jgi:hypothetical protein
MMAAFDNAGREIVAALDEALDELRKAQKDVRRMTAAIMYCEPLLPTAADRDNVQAMLAGKHDHAVDRILGSH